MAGCNLMALGVLLICSAAWVSATDYTVGDSTGWVLNYDYSTWTSSKSFIAGDKLVFNYATPQHNVEEVSKSAFDSCSSSKPISTDGSGDTTITLTTSGTHYFICGISGHCSRGMKLEVAVADSSSTTTSPSPPSTAAASPPSNTTTTNSGATGSLSPAHAMVVFAVVLKLGIF